MNAIATNVVVEMDVRRWLRANSSSGSAGSLEWRETRRAVHQAAMPGISATTATRNGEADENTNTVQCVLIRRLARTSGHARTARMISAAGEV